MAQILVWDLPTRLFHAFLAVGFVAAFSIAQFAGEHNQYFPYHMILGIVLGVMLVLRVLWGFLGTKYARFNSLVFTPSAFVTYMKDALKATGPRFTGHNPGSAYAIIAMLILLGVVVTTGLLMSNDVEAAEEVHAVAAYALLAIAIIHVLGVIWYSLRHRENISRSIITGYKLGTSAEAIDSPRPWTAAVFVAVVLFFAVGLIRGYDESESETSLPILGTRIHLGEE